MWPLLVVFAVALALGVLVAALLSAPAPALSGSPQNLKARGTSLAQREHTALLNLYASESRLAWARAAVVALRAQQATLARDGRDTARRGAIIRASLNEAQARVGQILRELYFQGQPDPIAVFLGATSLDDAIASIDSITRSARQNKRLIADMRLAEASVERIERTLAARGRELAAASAAADASAASLQLAVDARAGVVSSIRRERDITRRAIVRLEQQAKVAQQRSAKLSPPPATASNAARTTTTATTASTTPAPQAAPTPAAPTGTRTLVVDAVAYHLTGTTATGLPVGVGVMAVDPRVIPLGTRVFVPGYGPAVAADVGSAVIGNIIDLWMPTTAQARAWGRRTVTITIYG